MLICEAWLIYLIVVVVVWIVLSAVGAFNGMTKPAKFFLALLAGAIIIFFIMNNIEPIIPEDRFWFCLLILFAFLTPLLIGLWLLWNGGWDNMRNFATNGSQKINRTYVCSDGSDCYPIITEINGKDGKTTIYHR